MLTLAAETGESPLEKKRSEPPSATFHLSFNPFHSLISEGLTLIRTIDAGHDARVFTRHLF